MFITEAFAQTGGDASGTGMLIQFLPIVLIFVIMYFLILRPQRQKARLHQEMVELRPGTRWSPRAASSARSPRSTTKSFRWNLRGRPREGGSRHGAEVRAKGEPVKEGA
jgi:preprotein translocase subunit YajC